MRKMSISFRQSRVDQFVTRGNPCGRHEQKLDLQEVLSKATCLSSINEKIPQIEILLAYLPEILSEFLLNAVFRATRNFSLVLKDPQTD